MNTNKGEKVGELLRKPPRLTLEEIDAHPNFRGLSDEKKLELIEFIYQLSSVLYNCYFDADE